MLSSDRFNETDFSINHLSNMEVRLKLIQTHLSLHHAKIKEDIKSAIKNAVSVAEIWHILFKNKLFDICDEFMSIGIIPTQDEMNQVLDDKATGWFWLGNIGGGAATCLKLFCLNILPSQEALNTLSTIDNTSPWYWFLYDNEYIPVVEFLLKRHYLPSVEIINALRTVDSTSAIFWMSCNEKRIPFLKFFLHKDIPVKPELFNQPYPKDKMTATKYLSDDDGKYKILNRVAQLKELSVKYGIHSNTKIAMILSRKHRVQYCAYLYAYYTKISDKQLKSDNSLQQGPHKLPESLKKQNKLNLHNELIKDENLIAFIKYYMIDSLEKFCGNDFLSEFRALLTTSKEDREIARSFIHMIKETDDPRPCILSNNYCQTFFNRFEKHNKLSTIDDDLAKILNNGYHLSNIKGKS